MELSKAEPIINNLNNATNHINNILASIDNPKTLNDLQETAQSTRAITKKIDNFGDDMSKMIDDKELMNAIRRLTIGLAELFNELYPTIN